MEPPEQAPSTRPSRRQEGRWIIDMMSRPSESKWLRVVNALGAIAVAVILAAGGTWLIARGNILAGLWALAGVPAIYVMVKIGR